MIEPLLWSLLGGAVIALGMGPVIAWLNRTGALDVPNARSNHLRPTPVGGGILVLAVLLPMWLILADRPLLHIVLPAIGLAALSWADDRRGVSPLIRFPGHILAVVVALQFEPTFIYPLAQFVSEPVAYVIIAFVWVWFVNLFNFMDGIDGLTGVETASIGLGVMLVVLVYGFATDFAALGLCTAVAAMAFLIWNWQPAKVFMGDVGSVPLGFLLAWLLFSLAAAGPWIIALILPAYYLADSTLTLLHRMARRQKIWQAHREHFYQRAAIAGRRHAWVVCLVLVCNVILIGVSLAASRLGFAASFLVAAVPVLILLIILHRVGRNGPDSSGTPSA